MAEVRLSKITKTYSIGLSKLVAFLNEQGIPAELNPNAKISDEHLPLIEKQFGENLKLIKDSERVTIKLKEIIEMGSKRKVEQSTISEATVSSVQDNTDGSAAQSTDNWGKIVKIHKDRRTVRGRVLRKYLHGLIVDIDGFEAKLPTQNICDSEEELDGYIGQTLDLKVTRLFEDSKSAIVAHRHARRQERPLDNEDKFEQPILCSVNWFNDSYGVVSPCIALISEKLGKISEIFIHITNFDGEKHTIGRVDEQSLVLVSSIVKQPKKISATRWSKLEPSRETIHHIPPFLGKIKPESYGSHALSTSSIGKFIQRYLSNPQNPFIDIFAEAFNGTDRERAILFKWLREIRKEKLAINHPAYRQSIDEYLSRDEFYHGDINIEDITSLAVSGELPLSVIESEHLKVSYNIVSSFTERVIQELEKDSALYEDCFKEIFNTLKSELANQSNALKADSASGNLPVQAYGVSYSRSSSARAQDGRRHLLLTCSKTIEAYNTPDVHESSEVYGITLDLLDFYKLCLNISETLDERVEVRDALKTEDSFISSARDNLFEESLINNIAIDLLIKAVASGRIKFNSWDRTNGWETITSELAGYVIGSPGKFPKEHIVSIYKQVKQCGCLNKAYNLLNALDPIERDTEISQILTSLKENFIFANYEALLQQVEPDMIEDERVTDIRALANEFYIPFLTSRVDSIASARGYNWIHELYQIVSRIPIIIHDVAHFTILTYIKDIVKVFASIGEQFKAIKNKDIICPETWSDFTNLHTITIGDIDSLFASPQNSLCNEDPTKLIPLIKREKKYKEALHLAQKIGPYIKQRTDTEIYNEVSYEVYINLWLDGLGEQHDEALFVNGINYCATDSFTIPDDQYGIYEKCSLCLDKIETDFNADYRNAIIRLALEYLSPSNCRNHFQSYLAIIKYINSHNLDIDLGDEESGTDLKVALWFLDIGKKLSFSELKDYIVLFRPCQQQRVLKKIFHLFDKKGLTPNITNIYNLFEAKNELLDKIDDMDNEGLFDLSCRIVLYSLNKFAQSGEFIFEKDIFLEILMKQLTKNTKVKYRISGFFSHCVGRTKGKYNFENYNGVLTQVQGGYSITFNLRGDDLQELVTILKTISGRSYNSSTCAWFIPAQEEQRILLFARRYRISINFGPGSQYERNAHFIEPYRWQNPPDIVREFCDGVPYGEIQAYHKIPIMWCGSERCYQPCRKKHSEEEWEDYTMLDFCRILGYNTDAHDRQGDVKKDGAYLMFVSWVNWFNMMLEHLYCRECGLILTPDKISSVGRYGVTEFSCRNQECKKFKKSIYLNTCLNRNCRCVIDSRDCKQCPNEWYICPTCGSCCSNDMISRRYYALSDHNQYINTPLRIAFEQKSGHQDSDTVFCYKCGSQTEVHDGNYFCRNCNKTIEYKNRLKKKRYQQ